jgi:hypothetical protein
MIDSNRDIGINTKSNAALKFRKQTSCAPLFGDGMFDTPWTKTPPKKNGQ